MTADNSATSALLHEVAEARRLYVDNMVNAKINRCRGECSTAEITEWENDAHRRWRAKFPTLSGFLIPHGATPDQQPCTCPDSGGPWEPDWDGLTRVAADCHWHGARERSQPNPT